MTHAKHIQSTDDRKVLAYGRIKDGKTTIVVPSRPARHRELPTHVRDAVAWWTRTHYRLLRDEGVDRATARCPYVRPLPWGQSDE